jgi:hypothetical protein
MKKPVAIGSATPALIAHGPAQASDYAMIRRRDEVSLDEVELIVI